MSAMVDRIVTAIASKRRMTDEQTQAVREEVARFTHEMLERYHTRESEAR